MAAELAVILHAHLPYVRPEGEEILEERWLYEAVAETYLPLLWALERLQADGVPVRLSLSLSGPLLSMLADPHLIARCRSHLARTLALAEREAHRHEGGPVQAAASFHREHFARVLADFDRRKGDLIGAFRSLAEAGILELFTAAGTHGFLPLLASDEARAAQIDAGVAEFTHRCGGRPQGMWLPECAYAPGIDHLLAAAGIRWFVAESTTLGAAWPPIAGPVGLTPGGVAAFARDMEAARQVWDSRIGYPGDPVYREFYRDVGFDLPLEEVSDWLVEGRVRADTGLKFWSVTGDGENKKPYDPAAAAKRVQDHAQHFAAVLRRRRGLVVAPFDAELFGHWWFEGPAWLEALFRAIAGGVRSVSPYQWLDEHPSLPIARIPAGSWGDGGDYRVWLSPNNHWVWPALHAAEEQMLELAASAEASPARVSQAARELLLAESSDWPFIVHFKTTEGYAIRRFRDHLSRFGALVRGEGPEPAVGSAFMPSLDGSSLFGRRLPVTKDGPLRILMLSWEFPPNNVGGLGRHVYDLGAALTAAGHTVHVATLADEGQGAQVEQVAGMTVHRVARPREEGNFLVWVYRFNLALAEACVKAVSDEGAFQVIHSHDWLVGQAGMALKARWGSTLVATIHATEKGRNSTIRERMQQAIHEEEWLLCATADRVITVSQAMAREVGAGFRGAPTVIYNGVAQPARAGGPPHRFDAPYFFYVGRLVGEKGVQVAIKALAMMKQRAHFVVAGRGPMEGELRRLAKAEGIEPLVHFIGRISEEEKDAWLQNASAGLVPSLYEPFGIVALEVMAAGVPVVVGDTGGLAEIVTHRVDGLKVGPGDAAGLAAALDGLLVDTAEAARLAAAGRDTAAARFGWQAIAEETLAVYRGAQ